MSYNLKICSLALNCQFRVNLKIKQILSFKNQKKEDVLCPQEDQTKSTDRKNKEQPYIWIFCPHWPTPWTQHLRNLRCCSPCLGLASLRADNFWSIIQVWATIQCWPSPKPVTCTNWPWISAISLTRSFRIHFGYKCLPMEIYLLTYTCRSKCQQTADSTST